MPFSSVLGASSVVKPGVCTSATRPSAPYEGQLIYETDTDRVAAYNGSAWVYTHSSGLVFVTGASFSAVGSVSLPTNTFTSTYRNYLVLLQITAVGGSQNIIARLRKSGTDATTAYFNMLDGINSNGGDNNITSNNTGEWFVGRMLNAGANIVNATITVFGPQVNQKTGATIVMQGEDTSVGALGHAGGLFHSTADQYDSMTILGGSAQTITGTYRVYGYADS